MTTAFPPHIKTKADVKALIDSLFPKTADIALEQVLQSKPDATYPRYHVDHVMGDRIAALLQWLFEQRPKIYKRARGELFRGIASRLIELLQDNANQKLWDIDSPGRLESKLHQIEYAEALRFIYESNTTH